MRRDPDFGSFLRALHAQPEGSLGWGEGPSNEDIERFGLDLDRTIIAVPTGEVRAVKRGEWMIRTKRRRGYKARSDHPGPFEIAELVNTDDPRYRFQIT